MTKLSTIPQHQLSITCGLCKHHTMLEVANLIAVVGGDTTAHEVRQRARCNNCGVKGNNTYQIVVEPPHLNWSSAMFRKRRTDNDEQTTEAGRDYHEVEAS